MKKHQTVQVATGGQIKELASALVEAIPSNIAADKAQYWIGKRRNSPKRSGTFFLEVIQTPNSFLTGKISGKGLTAKSTIFQTSSFPKNQAKETGVYLSSLTLH